MNKEELLYEGKRTVTCILAALMYAVGLNLFVVPAQLYSGGLMGVCQVVRTLLVDYLHMNFQSFDIAGIIYYIINIPIFIIALAFQGDIRNAPDHGAIARSAARLCGFSAVGDVGIDSADSAASFFPAYPQK